MRIFKFAIIALGFLVILFITPAKSLLATEIMTAEATSQLSESQDIFPIDQDILNTLDEDQQKWFRRFNEGVWFFDGWQCISRSIIEQYPIEKQNEVKRFTQRIGILIGTEWSKDNDIRKIDNSQLDDWGDRLKEAVSKDISYLSHVLTQIDNEVKMLLQK